MIRHTLTLLAETKCSTAEEFKAWSQNLGHEDVLTTFTSYGEVPGHRQVEIMDGLRAAAPPKAANDEPDEETVQRVVKFLNRKASAS